MYTTDNQDLVVSITDLPQSSVGAPCPLVLSDESRTVVAYYLQETPSDWDGTAIRIISQQSDGESVALILFSICYAQMFGPPNDEAFAGHPLASRGLRSYSACLIENSSWVRQLERMNSVHPYHKPERFLERKHYVLAFHDTVFECVADGYSVELHENSIENLLPRMMELLNGR